MARPGRVPAICDVQLVRPDWRSTATICPDENGNTTVSPCTAGTDTPMTPDPDGVPAACHSTRPSLARTAQPTAFRAAT